MIQAPVSYTAVQTLSCSSSSHPFAGITQQKYALRFSMKNMKKLTSIVQLSVVVCIWRTVVSIAKYVHVDNLNESFRLPPPRCTSLR